MIPSPALAVMGTSAADVVPDAMNWGNISSSAGYGDNSPALTVSGITEAINFEVSISGFSRDNSNTFGYLFAIDHNGDTLGESTITGNGVVYEFTVTNGETVYFSGNGENYVVGSWSWSATVTIKYKSAGSSTYDQTLDTFTVTLSGNSLL